MIAPLTAGTMDAAGLETSRKFDGGKSAPIPESSKELRQQLVDSSVRSMHLQGLRSSDLTRRYASLRAGEIGGLRSGKYEKFGLNRLLTLHERLKSKFRFHVLLPACPERESDPALQRLFRALADVDDACERAAESLGERTNPLAKVAVLHAGTMSMLVVDAIRKAPHAWRREVSPFATLLLQVEEMLEGVRDKDWSVTKAIHALRVAGQLLEDAAGGRNSVDCGSPRRNC